MYCYETRNSSILKIIKDKYTLPYCEELPIEMNTKIKYNLIIFFFTKLLPNNEGQ